jgi:hypothetical protein
VQSPQSPLHHAIRMKCQQLLAGFIQVARLPTNSQKSAPRYRIFTIQSHYTEDVFNESLLWDLKRADAFDLLHFVERARHKLFVTDGPVAVSTARHVKLGGDAGKKLVLEDQRQRQERFSRYHLQHPVASMQKFSQVSALVHVP